MLLVLNTGQIFLDIPHSVGIGHRTNILIYHVLFVLNIGQTFLDIPHSVGIEHSNLDVHVDTFYWTIRRL